jgi:hypothetical protein
VVHDQLGRVADRAIRQPDRPAPEEEEKTMHDDPRPEASERVQRLMREQGVPFHKALEQLPQHDPRLAERLAAHYRGPAGAPAVTTKWDRKLVELHDDHDPRAELANKAKALVGAGRAKTLAEAIEVVRTEDKALAERVSRFYA